jgi:penicillin-binding protein 1C
VRALVLVGVEAFRDRLRRLGYEGLTQSGEFYGYSLALGSAEVSLWQQAQAYRTLARGGHWSALRIRSDDPEPTQRRELPADASFVVGDILSDRAARALTFGLDNQLNTAFWSAAKTGTSKDMRDNWCIGFSRNFTVAVWVGNFEGDAMHQVSGVTGAAPVWHELMSALHRDLESRPPSPAAGVEQAQAQFSPAVEPPRREWFLAGARLSRVVAASGNGEIARILAPSNGMVIALDPDIPSGRQRVAITVRGASARMSVSLNGTALGRATQSLLWTPQPGAYRLALEDERGQALDSVRFTVR